MDVLTFELSGKFAHFRKYYANNTALSFFMPPRTSLMGMLAAVMGYPKDSYYESLSSEHIRIGARILSPVKKRIHRVNWLKVEGGNDFRGKQSHTQTPFEMVSGISPVEDLVRYRIYLAAGEGENSVFPEICKALLAQRTVFPVSLGTANLGGSITQVQMKTAIPLAAKDGLFLFHSALNAQLVQAIDWDRSKKLNVEEELIPADFMKNGDRELRKMVRLIYSIDGQPFKAKFVGDAWKIDLDDQHVEHISFIE